MPLVCPACPARSERGLELHALAVESGDAPEVVDGVLRCTNCGRRHPVIGGVPLIVPDLAEALRSAGPSLLARDLPPEVLAVLAAAGPDEAPIAHEAALVGSFLDSSWGDCAEPPPDGPGTAFGFGALASKLAGRAGARVRRAIELGCGVGRGLSLLARGAELTVGLDAGPAALRYARRILAGLDTPYPRRAIGRSFAPAVIRAGPLATPGVQLLCADALSASLAPGSFDRVAALNLIDAVRSPQALLDVAEGLLAPGGELLLAAPYAWKSDEMAGPDPAAAVRAALEQRGLRIEDEDRHVPWALRRDARSASVFDVHWIRARKPV